MSRRGLGGQGSQYVPPSQRDAARSAGPRRASPPRPSMLVGPVGDIGAIERAFADLRVRVAQLRTQELSLGAGSQTEAGRLSDWQALVPRFRSLRESLTAAGCATVLAVEAYEASAEACLRAGDHGEFLKCQQRLVRELYPGHAGTPAASRMGEFAACGVLYFACVPTPPDAAEVRTGLRALPRHLVGCREVSVAVRALAAMSSGDYLWLCAAAADASTPALLRAMLLIRIGQVRERALRVMSAAYRQMPVASAERMLKLPSGGDALGAIVAIAAVQEGCTPGLKLASQNLLSGVKVGDLTFAK